MPKQLSKKEMKLLKNLGERIRFLRKEKGITQLDFAYKAKVNDNEESSFLDGWYNWIS